MITVKLLGGLGNQMFQYAYGLALKERGYKVEYDRTSLIEGTHREYSLGYFGIKADGVEKNPRYYEGNLTFNPTHLRPPDGSTVVGYWQTEKYFSDIAEKVRSTFRSSIPRAAFFAPTIALHVRRQDYVNLTHFHGMPTVDYYRAAVAHIRREAGELLRVFVFTDDVQWCRENLPSDFVISGLDKYKDLELMIACDYAVIANSSFSWWGAWLGAQRLVVAPKQWFTDPGTDYSDIVPDRWVRM